MGFYRLTYVYKSNPDANKCCLTATVTGNSIVVSGKSFKKILNKHFVAIGYSFVNVLIVSMMHFGSFCFHRNARQR